MKSNERAQQGGILTYVTRLVNICFFQPGKKGTRRYIRRHTKTHAFIHTYIRTNVYAYIHTYNNDIYNTYKCTDKDG